MRNVEQFSEDERARVSRFLESHYVLQGCEEVRTETFVNNRRMHPSLEEFSLSNSAVNDIQPLRSMVDRTFIVDGIGFFFGVCVAIIGL